MLDLLFISIWPNSTFLSVSVDMKKNPLYSEKEKSLTVTVLSQYSRISEPIPVNFCHVLAVAPISCPKRVFPFNVPDSYTLLDKSVQLLYLMNSLSTAQPCTSFCLNSEHEPLYSTRSVVLPGRVYIYSGKQKEMIACDSIFLSITLI